MGIKEVIGLFNPAAGKGKLMIAGAIALVVFVIWAGMKWDAWKIGNLEEENRKLEVEKQSSQQAADDAESVRAIDETAVTETLAKQIEANENSDEIREQVRDDVRRLQRELEEERRALKAARKEKAELEARKAELERTQPESSEEAPKQRPRTPRPEVVVETVEVPGPSVDARIAQRIVDGMWDNYCGQVPDDRHCTPRSPAEGDDTGGATE